MHARRRSSLSYDEHLDTLTALITYLGLAKSRSRTAPALAEELGLEASEVALVLDGFPGLFRESKNEREGRGRFYTLHARFALRRGDDGDAVLEPELLNTLLRLAADRAAAEQGRHQQRRANVLQLCVSGVAAVAAITAAAIAAGA